MTEKRQKKKKKQTRKVILKQKKEENQKFLELLELLDDLENEGEHVDIQICPHCKGPRVCSMDGDMSSHIGMLPVKFECRDCDWRERLVVKGTNKKLGLKEVAIIAEASGIKQ